MAVFCLNKERNPQMMHEVFPIHHVAAAVVRLQKGWNRCHECNRQSMWLLEELNVLALQFSRAPHNWTRRFLLGGGVLHLT
jgi:hypothetical protein